MATHAPIEQPPPDRLPGGRLPADRLPDGRLPADRLPDGRLPADRLPDGRQTGGRQAGGQHTNGRQAGDRAAGLRRALLFVGVSGAGWLLDLAVFLTLSGPVGWPPIAANVVSGSCGVLLVFIVSSSRIFRRNEGSVAQKLAVLLVFNFAAILASSVVLGLLAGWLARGAAAMAWAVPPVGIRLAAKVLVTPFTLALNFVVVRFLVERFVTLRTTPRAA